MVFLLLLISARGKGYFEELRKLGLRERVQYSMSSKAYGFAYLGRARHADRQILHTYTCMHSILYVYIYIHTDILVVKIAKEASVPDLHPLLDGVGSSPCAIVYRVHVRRQSRAGGTSLASLEV